MALKTPTGSYQLSIVLYSIVSYWPRPSDKKKNAWAVPRLATISHLLEVHGKLDKEISNLISARIMLL